MSWAGVDLSVTSVPSCRGAAHAVRLDLFLVAAGEVGPHRVRGQSPLLTPGGEVAPYVGVERVHEDLVREQDVAVPTRRVEGGGVEQQRPRRHLLDIEH